MHDYQPLGAGASNAVSYNPPGLPKPGSLATYLAARNREKKVPRGQRATSPDPSNTETTDSGEPNSSKRNKLLKSAGIGIGGTAVITGITYMHEVIDALKQGGITGGSIVIVLVILLLFNVPATFLQWRNSQDDRRERQADREERKELYGAIFDMHQETSAAINQNTAVMSQHTAVLTRIESAMDRHACPYAAHNGNSNIQLQDNDEPVRKRRQT